MRDDKPFKTLLLLAFIGLCVSCEEKEVLGELSDVPTATVESERNNNPYSRVWEMPDEMPIIGYRGIPRDFSTVEQYTLMKECGFNTNLAMFDSYTQLFPALEAAEEAGMKVIARWPGGFFSWPETYVPMTEEYPAFAAYFVEDEPRLYNLETDIERIEGIINAGATRPFYVNLAGNVSKSFYIDQGLSCYAEYLETCIYTLDPPFISFDIYPVIEENGEVTLRPTWYDNLQTIRELAIRTGKKFWAFACCCPHLSHPDPTLGHIRLQVNMDLAYGAQAIEYYTYWLPNGEGGNSDFTDGYHDAPIDEDGNPTVNYYLVRQVNEEVHEVAPLFYKGEITKVAHFTDEFEGVDIVSSSAGAVGSLLTSPAGDEYVVVVNKSFADTMTITYNGETYELEEGAMKVLPR